MLPIRLYLKNIGPYKDETIQFSNVNGDVVAIVGDNGAGKTMLIDAIFAALYRYFPSRDSIYKYCQGKDAQIELDFSMGGFPYKTRILINAEKRSMESWLFQGESATELSALTDGKNTTFDQKIREICGDSEAILASVYSAQNKAGSFSVLTKAKRKELFIEMLGLSKLEAIASECHDREQFCMDAHAKSLERFNALEPFAKYDAEKLPSMKADLEVVREEVQTAETGVREATIAVGALKTKAAHAKEVEARQFPLRKKIQENEKLAAETKKALAETQTLVDMAELYRADAEEYTGIEALLAQQKEAMALSQADITLYQKSLNQYNMALRDLERQRNDQGKIFSKANLELNRAIVDSAIIDTVPCHAEGECANCQFLVQANKAKESIPEIEEDKDSAEAAILALDAQVKALPAPDPNRLTASEASLKEAQSKIVGLESRLAKSDQAKAKLIRAEAAVGTLDNLKLRVQQLDSEKQALNLELESLENEIISARSYWDELRKAEKKLELEQEAVEASRFHLNNLLGDIGRAEAEIEKAKEAKNEMDLLEPNMKAQFKDAKSWAKLSKAFSKTGIQSLEIDAAGPIISEMINNLLFSCFGPRFSVRFVTQVMKDDKSGYKDDFDIYVTDANTGREGSIDDLSGGERVIVGEALSLALALFNRQRGGVAWESLFRDEASSAVDDRRAPLYIKMLRGAREQGHFLKLFFIAHQTRVTEGADSKLLVDNGKVSFE